MCVCMSQKQRGHIAGIAGSQSVLEWDIVLLQWLLIHPESLRISVSAETAEIFLFPWSRKEGLVFISLGVDEWRWLWMCLSGTSVWEMDNYSSPAPHIIPVVNIQKIYRLWQKRGPMLQRKQQLWLDGVVDWCQASPQMIVYNIV